MMSPDPSALALALIDAWNARKLARFLDLLAADVTWYDPAMPAPPARGRAEVARFAESVLHAFPDFQYELRAPVYVAPDHSSCVVPWRITATHMAPLTPPGYAPTHRRMVVDGLDQLEMNDGKVIRILTCFDTLAAAEQLLDITLRPQAGSVYQRAAVGLQRVMAARARRRVRRSS